MNQLLSKNMLSFYLVKGSKVNIPVGYRNIDNVNMRKVHAVADILPTEDYTDTAAADLKVIKQFFEGGAKTGQNTGSSRALPPKPENCETGKETKPV